MAETSESVYRTQVCTPQSCLSRELQQELSNRNMLTVKSRHKVCQLLDSLAVETDKIEKRESLRNKAVREILHTEKSYIKSLDVLNKFFVEPLRGIIDPGPHNLMFGHIGMIYNLNMELMTELEANLENVGSAFLKFAPFLKLYSVYAFDFKKALLTLQELTEKCSKFRQHLEKTETRPDVQTKLNSLLIVPIQRVPRYKMLLQQVLLYTSPLERDFKIIQDSIKQVENTANHINSLVEDQENTQEMMNLQNSLLCRNPCIIQPCRKLIKEGPLDKITRHGGRIRRYCVLMSDIFMYCKVLKERTSKSVGPIENSIQCCCIFPLKKCKVVELFPGAFRISCQGDGVILRTNNADECRQWVTAFKEAIEAHIQFRKTLRKESSKRRPLRKKKDMKNFDLEQQVVSPSKHESRFQRSEYDNILRLNSGSEDEEETQSSALCFKRILGKRKIVNHDNLENLYEHMSSPKITKTSDAGMNIDYTGQNDASKLKYDILAPPQQNNTPHPEMNDSSENSSVATTMRKVRFSNVVPVPFKYDDNQEYLNRRFLQRTITKTVIGRESIVQRISNFFSRWF